MRTHTLFKFKPINKFLFESLVNSELYFAPPKQLNDPFDCRVDVEKALDLAMARAAEPLRSRLEEFRDRPGQFDAVRRDLENVGVCAFSTDLNNTLMWSHYADSHAGVCLQYAIPEHFFEENREDIMGFSPVRYGTRPLVDWLVREAGEVCGVGALRLELVKAALSVKDRPWEYEKEVRILRRVVGPHPVSKGCLRQIYFGLKAADADVRLVRTLALDCGYSVAFGRMVRRRDSDFELEAVPL